MVVRAPDSAPESPLRQEHGGGLGVPRFGLLIVIGGWWDELGKPRNWTETAARLGMLLRG